MKPLQNDSPQAKKSGKKQCILSIKLLWTTTNTWPLVPLFRQVAKLFRTSGNSKLNTMPMATLRSSKHVKYPIGVHNYQVSISLKLIPLSFGALQFWTNFGTAATWRMRSQQFGIGTAYLIVAASRLWRVFPPGCRCMLTWPHRIKQKMNARPVFYEITSDTFLLLQNSRMTIFVNVGLFWHFETVTNIRTWIKSHRYWRML